MKDYNGFTGNQRNRVATIIRKAINKGDISPPQKCDICGQDKGQIHYHLEDYSKPLEDLKPICVGCHMRLHIRFEYPNLWKQHLLDIRAGKKSPPYTSTFAFFKAMRSAGITADIAATPALDNPRLWYELLHLTPINLNF